MYAALLIFGKPQYLTKLLEETVMVKQIRKLAPVALVTLPLLGLAANAGAEAEQAVNLNSYLCKDVMRLPGEDRTAAIAAFHGYMLGKKGVVTFVVDDLNKVSNAFIEYCLDNPHDKALEAFEKLAK